MDDSALLKKKLLRPDEVARILRVSQRHVYHLVSMGRLTTPEGIGRVVRIHTSSVCEILDEDPGCS